MLFFHTLKKGFKKVRLRCFVNNKHGIQNGINHRNKSWDSNTSKWIQMVSWSYTTITIINFCIPIIEPINISSYFFKELLILNGNIVFAFRMMQKLYEGTPDNELPSGAKAVNLKFNNTSTPFKQVCTQRLKGYLDRITDSQYIHLP